MLYHLMNWLEDAGIKFPGSALFQFITSRVLLAVIISLIVSALFGKKLINYLRKKQVGETVRDLGLAGEQQKKGTPTMGGLLILVAIAVSTLLWADIRNRFVWIVLAVTVAFGLIGFWDDYLKLVVGNSKGLVARYKYFWQTVAGLGCAYALYITARTPAETALFVPLFKQVAIPLSAITYIVLTYLVIVGSSNAVNLTDGLDGLAIGCTIIAAGALTVLTYVSGHVVFSDYLELQRMPMVSELTIFCGAMVGASIGFLWYNAHPAEIFMGDVGSLALGGAIGTVAVAIKQELLLPFIGGVFILEALSVMLQVGSYKLRNGKRIFKMAPLHHHFELLGWSESKVIARFWILALIFALLALTTLKLR